MTLAPIPLRDAAYKHVEDMAQLRRLAQATRLNIKSAYHNLAAYLETRHEREPMTNDVNYEALEMYFRDVVSTQADGTYRTKRARCIMIVEWLMRRGYLEWGPNFAEDIPVRKMDQITTRKRRFSDDEFLKFLAAAKRSNVRDYFLALFMRFTGRRASEVLGNSPLGLQPMVWGDIRWDEGQIYWNNYKARKFGLRMPLTPRLRAILEAWKAAYCENVGVSDVRNDWVLFPALTGTGPVAKGRRRVRTLSPEFIFTNHDKAFRAIMKASGLGHQSGDGWHVLRKTYGNQRKRSAVEAGRADAKELTKNALGHASEDTQRIYLDEDEEYDRYAVWAMESAEMGLDAMAKIPELSALAASAALDAQKAPTSDAREADQVDDVNRESSNLVNFASFASRRRALG